MFKLKSKQLILPSLIAVMILTASCSSGGNASTSNNQSNKTEQTSSETTTPKELSLTLDELKQYDGQNGNPAYVAVDGVIYDVSSVRKWKNGKHEMGITAGQDLSELISQSPHGKAILSEAPVVGKIK